MNLSWPIIGNEERLQELESDLTNRRLSHAYLISGPEEVGKFSAAKFLASAIVTIDSPDPEIIKKQIRSGTCSYLTVADKLWIEGINEDGEELGKFTNFNQAHRSRAPKAKTDTIGIDDLTEILARIHDRHEGYQVILIRQIERLTREATNSFLKILEEPPARTVFILTTDNLPLVLSTVVSRCRVVQFSNVRSEIINTKLTELRPELSESERQRIVNFSLGKPGRAIRLISDPEVLTNYAEYFRRLKNLFEKSDLAGKLNFAEEVAKTTSDVAIFLEALTYFLRSFLLTRARKPEAGSRYSTTKLIELLYATHTTRELINHNVNVKLAIENLLLKI